MIKLGVLLIAAGFISGALFTTLDVTSVPWIPFSAALATGMLGIVLLRRSHKKQVMAKDTLAKNMAGIAASISNIVENLRALNKRKEEINTYDMLHQIDKLFLGDLNTFTEMRKSIIHTYGLQAYANIMSYFAAGDRYLNRVWCASADGYIDEVHLCLSKALEQFEDSQKRLDECRT